MKLRYYQEESIVGTFNYFAQGGVGNPINVLPTGTGKSLCIAEFIKRALTIYPNTRVMMLTHVKELIENNFDTLLKIWPTAPAGVYSAGLRRKDSNMPITYAGIGSVAKKAVLFGHIDLVLVDECHLVSPNKSTQYQKFFAALRLVNPAMRVIGYTATPYRLGVGKIVDGGLFTDICYDASGVDAFNKLITEGFLAPVVPKKTGTQLDVENVRKSGGEFVQRALQEAVDKISVTRSALKELLDQGVDRKHWLIFATGIQHADHIVAMLEKMGVPALSVHSKLTTAQRDQAIADFRSGKIRALVNNNVLTTGFDFPGIDLIAVLRPTSSASLWVQMLGRGTRPAPGKTDCLVLDFAGNTERLGPINDPIMPQKKGKGGGGVAPVRLCPECATYCHASVRVCPECGYKYPEIVRIKDVAGSGELIVKNEPKVATFTVTEINYTVHQPNNGKPPSMLVTYTCGFRVFKKWVCLEHSGWAGKESRKWWGEHCTSEGMQAPSSIADAVGRCGELKTPPCIRVWVNRKPYPQVMCSQWEQ